MSDKWNVPAKAVIRNFIFKKLPPKRFFFVEEAKNMLSLFKGLLTDLNKILNFKLRDENASNKAG